MLRYGIAYFSELYWGRKLKNTILHKIILFISMSLVSGILHATVITFDDAITGATSYTFDADGDLIDDVIFSTTDGSGFNTVGPGPNMSFIDEPGLEGTTLFSPDLRVDFLNGAVTNLGFGFAMNNLSGPVDGVLFSVYDGSDNLLNSIFQTADFTATTAGTSNFPEALVSLNFSGLAAYATFDFSQVASSRYILDNFNGTFGSTDDITVPEPSILALLSLGIFGIGVARRKKA